MLLDQGAFFQSWADEKPYLKYSGKWKKRHTYTFRTNIKALDF
jgi:hypothetical protein